MIAPHPSTLHLALWAFAETAQEFAAAFFLVLSVMVCLLALRSYTKGEELPEDATDADMATDLDAQLRDAACDRALGSGGRWL